MLSAYVLSVIVIRGQGPRTPTGAYPAHIAHFGEVHQDHNSCVWCEPQHHFSKVMLSCSPNTTFAPTLDSLNLPNSLFVEAKPMLLAPRRPSSTA